MACDMPAERLDDARRERLADERPEPRVVGRVAEQHRHREPRAVRPAAEAGLEERLVSTLAEARVPEEARHVVVPGEDVEPERVAVDGVLGAKPVVGGIRILEERGIEEVQLSHARPPTRRV